LKAELLDLLAHGLDEFEAEFSIRVPHSSSTVHAAMLELAENVALGQPSDGIPRVLRVPRKPTVTVRQPADDRNKCVLSIDMGDYGGGKVLALCVVSTGARAVDKSTLCM